MPTILIHAHCTSFTWYGEVIVRGIEMVQALANELPLGTFDSKFFLWANLERVREMETGFLSQRVGSLPILWIQVLQKLVFNASGNQDDGGFNVQFDCLINTAPCFRGYKTPLEATYLYR